MGLTKKERGKRIVALLKTQYSDAQCSLETKDALQLLIATRLSAQCTDARVNLVTPVLFEAYKTVEDFAAAEVGDVEKIIKSCGLYKTKANDIVAMCRQLVEQHGGVIPDTVEELTTLPGVGRKTANLVAGEIYGKPAIVADTHCIRLSNRMGFCDSKDPLKVERQLSVVIEPAEQLHFCHRLVHHGRAVCTARNPQCGDCVINEVCQKRMEKPVRRKKI